MSKFKNQNVNFYYTVQYITTNLPDFRNFRYCFAFTALEIDKTFTKRYFLSSKIKIMSMCFPIKIEEQTRPKICEKLRTANFNTKFTG